MPKTAVEGITWLRAQGRNGSTGGGFPLDGTRLGGIPCAAGCEQHGNCNRDSGRCECPFGRVGAACEVVALPACRLADRPDALMVCPWQSDAWRTVACACHSQCAQHIQDLGDLLDYPEELQPANATGCFAWAELPPERQWSDFPAAGQQGVQYFRNALNDSAEATREEVAVVEDREQLPLSKCPNNCNFAGLCTRSPGNDTDVPACRCLWPYLGRDCSEHHQQGTVFEMCPGTCNGVGRCMLGFCHCPPGLWGIDCRRSKAWAPQPQQPKQQQMLIYVYDLPFTLTHMHAARHLRAAAIYQAYVAFFHTLLADLGGARTENPYEATLFLIPAQLFQWTDNLGFPREHLLKVTQWVVRSHPFWNASGGVDHLLWWPNDQGAAWSLYNSPGKHPADYALLEPPVKATHFCYSGPGAEESSKRTRYGKFGYVGKAWVPGYTFQPTTDVCAAPSRYQTWMPGECQDTYGMVPQNDTALRADENYLPLGNRSTLLYFLGGAVFPILSYSAGARQSLFNEHFNKTPGFRISYGPDLDPPLRGNVIEERDSMFCFAPSGHGFGMRLIDALSHGCIPVIAQDEVTQYFEDVVPYTAFTLRVGQGDIPQLHHILNSLQRREVALLQWGLVDYHRAFVWPQPYGLAYNYTIASLRRAMANRHSMSALMPHTSWRSWLHSSGGGGA